MERKTSCHGGAENQPGCEPVGQFEIQLYRRVAAQAKGAESPSMDMLVSAIGMVMDRNHDQKQRGHAGSSNDIPLHLTKKTVPPQKAAHDSNVIEEPEASAEDEAQILPKEEAPMKTKKRPLLALPDITAAEQADWLKKPSTITTAEAPHLGADPLNFGPMVGSELFTPCIRTLHRPNNAPRTLNSCRPHIYTDLERVGRFRVQI